MKKALMYGMCALLISSSVPALAATTSQPGKHFSFSIILMAPGRHLTAAELKHNETVLDTNEPACQSKKVIWSEFAKCMKDRALIEKQRGELWPKDLLVVYTTDPNASDIGRTCKVDDECPGDLACTKGACAIDPSLYH